MGKSILNADMDVEKEELYTVGGNVISTTIMENNIKISQKN
jgi:hypothetical protein